MPRKSVSIDYKKRQYLLESGPDSSHCPSTHRAGPCLQAWMRHPPCVSFPIFLYSNFSHWSKHSPNTTFLRKCFRGPWVGISHSPILGPSPVLTNVTACYVRHAFCHRLSLSLSSTVRDSGAKGTGEGPLCQFTDSLTFSSKEITLGEQPLHQLIWEFSTEQRHGEKQ